MDFRWAVENSISTGSLPQLEEDVRQLQARGIRAVLSLSAVSWRVKSLLKEAGIEHVDAQMPDFSAPGMEEMDELASLINGWISQKKPVYVHCYAGVGRCRTVVCCFLARETGDVEEVFAMVGVPETSGQKEMVRDYASGKREAP